MGDSEDKKPGPSMVTREGKANPWKPMVYFSRFRFSGLSLKAYRNAVSGNDAGKDIEAFKL